MSDQFQYVMAPVSIVVGLALTHVLAAFGVAVSRLRGHGKPIRLEAVYLFWAAFVLLWIVSFWWFEYKFEQVGTTWTFGLYLFVLLYSSLLYFLAVILVPRGMKDLDDSFEWFMSGRRWFFGVFVAANVVDFVDAWLKSRAWALTPSYLVLQGVFLVAAVVGIRSTSRRVQLVIAMVLFGYQLTYTAIVQMVLGHW